MILLMKNVISNDEWAFTLSLGNCEFESKPMAGNLREKKCACALRQGGVAFIK